MWRLLLIRCPVDETVHSVKSELPRASASRAAKRSPTGANPEGLGPARLEGPAACGRHRGRGEKGARSAGRERGSPRGSGGAAGGERRMGPMRAEWVSRPGEGKKEEG